MYIVQDICYCFHSKTDLMCLKVGYWLENSNRMENSSKEEYKIQSFDLETQQLLKTALKGHYLESAAVLHLHILQLGSQMCFFFLLSHQTQAQLIWRKCPV